MIGGFRGSKAFFVVVMIILISGFYVGMELNVMDKAGTPTDVAIKSQEQTSQEQLDTSSGISSDEKGEDKVKGKGNGKGDKDCKTFDHGDITPLEDVESIFNCGGKNGTCHWYYPAKFLDQSCGVGKEFNTGMKEMKKLYDDRELWLSGPPIVLPYAKIIPEKMKMPNNKHTGKPWTRHTLSMTHVHKTGGTSLVTSFSSILGKGAMGKRHTVYMPGAKPLTGEKLAKANRQADEREQRTGKRPPVGSRKSITYGAGYNESSAFLDNAVKYQRPEDWGDNDHTLFAVVRDPAERFISAIGQATGAYGSTSNGIGTQLMDQCLKETSRQTLRCFIDLMHTNSTWIEVHFTPMVLEISFATIYKDIPVAVFPFQEVPHLLAELGSDPNVKKKDGHVSGYRRSDILTNMTVADYDDDMMKSLCDVYKMDALFLVHIGMSSRCDKFLQKE